MRFPHKAERVTHHKVVAPAKGEMMIYNSSTNAGIPVGFRFHPTDEELVGFYLSGRIATPPPDPREEDLRIIRELDLYRHEPWDLSEVCKIPGDHSVNQNNWYFFSHKDKKYPTGNRANRATKAGFWKATGRDKCIQTRAAVGMRKTLVFYRGRAPHGQKTDWIMHEFRLDDGTAATNPASAPGAQRALAYDLHEGAGAWVVCRVFRKTKNLKSKGDNDTPTTSLEEDHQMALLPEITDSTEKFSSDEGEQIDYAPADMVQHHFNSTYTAMQQPSNNQHCKQELLSVMNFAHIGTEHGGILAPPASMFRSQTPNYNTFQLDPAIEFEHHMMAHMGSSSSGASSSSAAGLFSPLPNNAYLAMLDDHVARGDTRGLAASYRRDGPAMLDGLEDFSRFGGNPVSMLDQSLADVVTQPLQQLQQLQQCSELLSSTSHHDMVPFGLPWQGGAGPRSGGGAHQLPPSFVAYCDSVNPTFHLSSQGQ